MGLYNNSRGIMRKAEENFRNHPSVSAAQKLERLGYSVDYSAKDEGEEPNRYPRYEGKPLSDEQLGELL